MILSNFITQDTQDARGWAVKGQSHTSVESGGSYPAKAMIVVSLFLRK